MENGRESANEINVKEHKIILMFTLISKSCLQFLCIKSIFLKYHFFNTYMIPMLNVD